MSQLATMTHTDSQDIETVDKGSENRTSFPLFVDSQDTSSTTDMSAAATEAESLVAIAEQEENTAAVGSQMDSIACRSSVAAKMVDPDISISNKDIRLSASVAPPISAPVSDSVSDPASPPHPPHAQLTANLSTSTTPPLHLVATPEAPAAQSNTLYEDQFAFPHDWLYLYRLPPMHQAQIAIPDTATASDLQNDLDVSRLMAWLADSVGAPGMFRNMARGDLENVFRRSEDERRNAATVGLIPTSNRVVIGSYAIPQLVRWHRRGVLIPGNDDPTLIPYGYDSAAYREHGLNISLLHPPGFAPTDRGDAALLNIDAAMQDANGSDAGTTLDALSFGSALPPLSPALTGNTLLTGDPWPSMPPPGLDADMRHANSEADDTSSLVGNYGASEPGDQPFESDNDEYNDIFS